MKNKLIALLTMSALAVGTLAGCGNTAATDTAASAADTVAETPVEAVRLLKLLTQPQTVQTNMQIFPVPSACPVPLPWKSWQMQLQKASWKNIPT